MIHFFFRKKREGANSIEMVFDGIRDYLPESRDYNLPCSRPTLFSIAINILYAKMHQGDVNHITGDAHYIAIGLGRNTILTVHDIGSSQNGGWLKRKFIECLWYRWPAKRVSFITVISEFTKRELSSLIPKYAYKIVVINNAFNTNMIYTPKTFNAICPTILHMGTKSNKNLERTIMALSDIQCNLFIVGKLKEEQIDLLRRYKIKYQNFCDVMYEKIVELYRQCDIVSFPSLYEGFGVPVLEANATGRPILCGDIEVLHEVAKNSAIFVNPQSVESIREGFTELIQNEVLREQLIHSGQENVKRFSHEIIASQYKKLYQQVLL